MEQQIREGLRALALPAEEHVVNMLSDYAGRMLERNQSVNLTAITEPDRVVMFHVLDSAALLRAADFSGKRVIDIGTGAGFPGMVLKILEPSIELTVLDGTGKKLDFIREASGAMGINDVRILHGRAEEQALLPEFRDRFDLAVSRAVAEMRMLAELTLPFVAPGGQLLAMKADGCAEELHAAEHAVSVLGAAFAAPFRYQIPGTDLTRQVAVMSKIGVTPRGYPRRFSKIQKNPL